MKAHIVTPKSINIIFSGIIAAALTLILATNVYGSDDVDYSVIVEPVLSITTSGDTDGVVSLDLNPETKTFASKDLTVTVNTNNETGYKLYVNTTGDTTNLVEKNDSNLYIETLSSEVSESNFTANRWGYKLNSSNTNYAPFVSGTLVNSSNIATSGVSSTLTFGAKASYDTKAGSYALALNFQATANPVYPKMQNLNSSLCTATPMIVVDARDQKEYTVARLADGKCWMITNLNLAGGTKLYSETSDVPDGYPESGGTGYYTLPASSPEGFSDNSTAYVYNTGLETSNQSDCTSTQACNSYYSWLAATAGGKDASGNNVTLAGYNAAYSVCPKGWRLPTATTSNANAHNNGNWKTGDFYPLATRYGANLESNNYEDSSTFYNNAGPGTIANFLLTGHYRYGGLTNGGSRGYSWSSTSNGGGGTEASYLYFNPSRISVDGYYRYFGFPVRCLLSE